MNSDEKNLNSITHTSSVLILLDRGNGELSELEDSGQPDGVPRNAQTG